MSGFEVVIHLAGAIALLLWAARMVRTGIERAYGAMLTRALAGRLGTRGGAALGGFVLAVSMQSSTAAILVVSGFVAAGHLSGAAAVTAAVGADLGSAMVIKLLRLDLSLAVPLLLLAGMASFRMSDGRRPRQLGRILFGFGLLLLSLQMIGAASAPLRDSAILPVALAHFASDWISLAMIVAVLTWLFHSSVAAILLFALLTDRGVLPDSLIVPIVLGVNLGAGAIALGLGRSLDPRGRIAPVANVLLRGGLAGGVLLASLMTPITLPAWLGAGGDALVLAHIGFNLALFAFGMALAGPVSALVSRWLLPLPAVAPLRARRSALMDEDIARPAIAVQNVARELVAMGERVDTMVASVPALFRATDEKAFAETMLLDDEVDRIHGDIKLYLARIGREACDEATEARLVRLMTAANRLEQIGDIVVHKVLARARKKHARGSDFSPEGWRELNRLHEEVMESVRLSLNVMVSGDLALARALAEQKQVVRDLETDSAHRHMERIRAGLAASLETSDVHIDALYDLKEINSLLVTLAYPLLDAAGQLRATRLRKVDTAPLAS